MEHSGLDQRHRDKNGEIAPKHGNTLVATLGKIYGRGFAPGCRDDERLSDVMDALGEHSLSMLVRDHSRGDLDKKVGQASG